MYILIIWTIEIFPLCLLPGLPVPIFFLSSLLFLHFHICRRLLQFFDLILCVFSFLFLEFFWRYFLNKPLRYRLLWLIAVFSTFYHPWLLTLTLTRFDDDSLLFLLLIVLSGILSHTCALYEWFLLFYLNFLHSRLELLSGRRIVNMCLIRIHIDFLIKIVVVMMFVLWLAGARSLIDLQTVLDTPNPANKKRSGHLLEETPEESATHWSPTTCIDHGPDSWADDVQDHTYKSLAAIHRIDWLMSPDTRPHLYLI